MTNVRTIAAASNRRSAPEYISKGLGGVFADRIIVVLTRGSTCPYLSPAERATANETLCPTGKIQRDLYERYYTAIKASLQSQFTSISYTIDRNQMKNRATQELSGCPGDWGNTWNSETEQRLRAIRAGTVLDDFDYAQTIDMLEFRTSSNALADYLVETLRLPRPQGKTCAGYDTAVMRQEHFMNEDHSSAFTWAWMNFTGTWPIMALPPTMWRNPRNERLFQYLRPVWYVAEAVALRFLMNGCPPQDHQRNIQAYIAMDIRTEMTRLLNEHVRTLLAFQPLQIVADNFLAVASSNLNIDQGRVERLEAQKAKRDHAAPSPHGAKAPGTPSGNCFMKAKKADSRLGARTLATKGTTTVTKEPEPVVGGLPPHLLFRNPQTPSSNAAVAQQPGNVVGGLPPHVLFRDCKPAADTHSTCKAVRDSERDSERDGDVVGGVPPHVLFRKTRPDVRQRLPTGTTVQVAS